MRSNVKRTAWRAWAGAAMMFCGTAVSNAAVVPFATVTGSFDQGGAYTVGGTIDGIVGGDNGWGVFGGQFTPQSAIFTTSAPVSSPQLAFEMMQVFPDLHNINEFRISVTQDANPTDASAWTPLNITNAAAAADLFKMADGHVLARGITSADNYQLRAASPFNNIRGVRLETFPVDYNTTDGLGPSLGRSPNGNYVLSEFVMRDSTAGMLTNVAVGHPTTQSTDGFGFDGSRAVDGIIYGGNITHTNSGDLAPFWEVDLEQTQLIDNITVYNRIGCCPDRLYNITVEVRNAADAVVYTSDVFNPVPSGGTPPADPGASFSIDLPGAGVNGSKVRVVKEVTAGSEWLSLTEVQVNIASSLPGINVLGDFTGDGLITVTDFDILRNNFHEGTTYEQGDINFDGQIDLNDFTTFVNVYNAANSSSVPEPSTWALLGVGAIFVGLVRRRRNSG